MKYSIDENVVYFDGTNEKFVFRLREIQKISILHMLSESQIFITIGNISNEVIRFDGVNHFLESESVFDSLLKMMRKENG